MPEFIFLGGPNGVGKSTLADTFYADAGFEVINSDRILAQLSKENTPNSDPTILAKGVVNQRIKDAFKSRNSFLIESNLNIPSSYKLMDIALKNGYKIRLKFMCVDNLEILNERIEERAIRGLHYISPHEVEQKYQSALRLLPSKIALFDDCELLDNSRNRSEPIAILTFKKGELIFQNKKLPDWTQKVLNKYNHLKKYLDKIKSRGI